MLGGDGLAGFELRVETDAYVNVAMPPAHADYTAPFDLDRIARCRSRRIAVFLDLRPLDSSVGEEESPKVHRSAPTASRGSSGTC